MGFIKCSWCRWITTSWNAKPLFPTKRHDWVGVELLWTFHWSWKTEVLPLIVGSLRWSRVSHSHWLCAIVSLLISNASWLTAPTDQGAVQTRLLASDDKLMSSFLLLSCVHTQQHQQQHGEQFHMHGRFSPSICASFGRNRIPVLVLWTLASDQAPASQPFHSASLEKLSFWRWQLGLALDTEMIMKWPYVCLSLFQHCQGPSIKSIDHR